MTDFGVNEQTKKKVDSVIIWQTDDIFLQEH
jgi:hypothetical protein